MTSMSASEWNRWGVGPQIGGCVLMLVRNVFTKQLWRTATGVVLLVELGSEHISHNTFVYRQCLYLSVYAFPCVVAWGGGGGKDGSCGTHFPRDCAHTRET